MRSKLLSVTLVGVIAFLLITNPVVSQAARELTGADIANGSITGKDVKNHSLTPRDFKGSVRGPAGPQGSAGPKGAAGETGPTGPRGLPGADGTARAYGSFLSSGLPTAISRSQSLQVSSHPGTGVYCLAADNVRATASIPMVTPDDDTVLINAQIASSAPDCPSNTWEVVLFKTSTAARFNAAFSAIIP